MNHLMQHAIAQAQLALSKHEFPVGAVIAHKGSIIASAHNLVQEKANPTLHAEMICIDKALRAIGEKYLIDCDIYVTLEPCLMCFKAISLVKLRRVYVAAMNTEDKYSIERLDPKALDLNHIPEIITGVCEEQAKNLFYKHLKSLRQ